MSTVPEKHILFISYYFPPMGGGGVQRILKFLKYWDKKACRLSVLTVKPSYFYAEDPGLIGEVPAEVTVYRSGSLDPFRLMYLLKRLFRAISRRASGGGHRRESGRLVRRISGFLFLPDSRLLWLPFALWHIRAIHRRQPVDAIVASVSPFTAGIIGALCRILWGIPFVLDLRDAWTNNPFHPTITPWHTRLQRQLEGFAVKRAAALAFVNHRLSQDYHQRYPFLGQRPTAVIRNGYDPADFENLPEPVVPPDPGRLSVGVFGTIYSRGNWPVPLIRAVNRLLEENPALNEKLRIYFVGKWSADFLEWLRTNDRTEVVRLIGYLPHRQMLAQASAMDVLTISHEAELPGSETITPGRIYEFFYLKKPILALCHPRSDIADLIRSTASGEVLTYGDVPGIVEILKNWLTRPDDFQQKYQFRDIGQFNRQTLTGRMMELTNRVV